LSALILALALATGSPQPPVDVGSVDLPAPDQKLVLDDVKDRSFVELAILRNHIYARYGRGFTKDWVQAFFDKQPWYKPGEFSQGELNATDRANLAVIRKAETNIAPADLRVRRNTVFARHGRQFKSADLQKHFQAQPWYKPDPKFTMDRLTPRDTLEVQLIQDIESKAKAVQGLDQWAPGRRISKKTLNDASEWDLAGLAIKMIDRLQLAGYGDATCNGPVGMLSEYEDTYCDKWKKHTREPRKLPKVDRKTWGALERRLAELAVTLDHPHHEPCEFSCEGDEGSKQFNACIDRCEAEAEALQKQHEKEQKRRLAKVKKGQHAHGEKLLNELMSVLAQSAA
jgi:hypothetical protein